MSETTRVIGELDDFLEDQIIRLTLEATANLVEATPIDTGFARANWVPQIGAPFSETAGTTEQAKAGSISTSEQQNGVASVSTQYRLPNVVFITNNVSYITRLNEGSSAQAPAGFVQLEIDKAIREVS